MENSDLRASRKALPPLQRGGFLVLRERAGRFQQRAMGAADVMPKTCLSAVVLSRMYSLFRLALVRSALCAWRRALSALARSSLARLLPTLARLS